MCFEMVTSHFHSKGVKSREKMLRRLFWNEEDSKGWKTTVISFFEEKKNIISLIEDNCYGMRATLRE